MYFKNLTERIDSIPNYFISNILEHREKFKFNEDLRAIIGKGNKIQKFPDIDMQVLRRVNGISAFIMSQQYPILKNMVVIESMMASPADTEYADVVMPTRYLNRIGELFLIPISGKATIVSHEFSACELESGGVYRINNRINSRFICSKDFISVAFNFIDFDLKNYLMPHDLNSPFIRRSDEYIDPSMAPKHTKEPKDAY